MIQADGKCVLVDAGLSCRELERRMSYFGAEPSQVDAVILTHEHTDHVRGARRFCSEHEVTAYGTRGTLALTPLGDAKASVIAAGKAFSIGPLRFAPFRVRHLAAEPVALSVAVGHAKIGMASDLGCITPTVVEGLKGSELMLVEANYDDAMLMEGDYPDFLKKTIRGSHGHLSNDDAGILAARSATDATQRIVLVHLSKENNTPDIARSTVGKSLQQHGLDKDLVAAEHGVPCGPFGLR